MAGKRKISLVLADVDGTLVTEDKILTKRACEAVNALQDAGIRFAAAQAAGAGATAIVAGSAIFGAKDYVKAIADIRARAAAAAVTA